MEEEAVADDPSRAKVTIRKRLAYYLVACAPALVTLPLLLFMADDFGHIRSGWLPVMTYILGTFSLIILHHWSVRYLGHLNGYPTAVSYSIPMTFLMCLGNFDLVILGCYALGLRISVDSGVRCGNGVLFL